MLILNFFGTTHFQLSFSLLQMNVARRPSRIRHNGDTGADVQQGPAQRFLFRLRPCVNLFYCLLLLHVPWFFLSDITKEEAGVLACGHVRIFARTWTLGAFLIIKSVVSPALIRPNTLGSVRRHEFLALYASAPNHVFGQMLGCPAPEFG